MTLSATSELISGKREHSGPGSRFTQRLSSPAGQRFLAGVLCCTLAPVLWGGNFLVGGIVAGEMPPAWLNFLRWCVAALVLAPFCLVPTLRHGRQIKTDLGRLTVLASLGVAGFNLVLYRGLELASVTAASIAFALVPLIVMLLLAIIRRRLPGAVQIVAVGLSLIGIWLMETSGGNAGPSTVSVHQGFLWVFGASVIWALYCVSLCHLAPSLPLHVSFFTQVLIGLFLQLPILLIVGDMPDIRNLEPSIWLAVGYLGIFAAALAFMLWQAGLRRMGPDTAALFMNLVPLTGIISSVLFLDEQMGFGTFIGISLVFSSVLMAGRVEAVRAAKSMVNR